MNNRNEILNHIQQTIINCDNKAAYLITSVGIVFGFSVFSIDHVLRTSGIIKVLIYCVGFLYLLTFILALTLLILVVFPRKKKNKQSPAYAHYSEDLFKHISDEDFKAFVDSDNEDALIDQIKECARIAHIKIKLLRVASVAIVIFGSLLVVLIALFSV